MGLKVKDLRDWLKVVPEEYDDCQVVYRTIMPATDNTDELMALDEIITGASIDVGEREACFFNETSYQLSHDTDKPDEENES